MSHREGAPGDNYGMDPKEILSQYSVEWVSLKRAYEEVKERLRRVREELNRIDLMLQNNQMTEQEHMERYHQLWLESTESIQIKREIEARLFEIQQEMKKVDRELRIREEERRRQEMAEQERANAMIEWMALREGFDFITKKRREINSEMDRLESQRRQKELSEEEYRRRHLESLRQLAELRSIEADVKNRLNELLEIIRA